MLITNLKIFLKFLARNKVYSLVTILGFAVSLMFVIVLGLYVKQELSVDKFHDRKDRIFLAVNDSRTGENSGAFAPAIGPWLAEHYPDIESYVRLFSENQAVEQPDKEDLAVKGLYADSTFFNIFSFPLVAGEPGAVLADKTSVVLSSSLADRVFEGRDPVGQTIKISGKDYHVTGVYADFPTNTIFPTSDYIGNFLRLPEFNGGERILTELYNAGAATMFILQREGGDIRSRSEAIVEEFKTFYWPYQEGFYTGIEFIPLEDVYFSGAESFSMEMEHSVMARVSLYLGIALLILVVSMLNYVNMTVAQSGFRGKEVALKKLHGAGQGAVVVQMLVESLVVTLVSFVIGLGFAFLAESFFDNALDTTLGLASALTLPVILIMLGLVVLLAVVSGIIPAVLISRFKPIEIIKGSFSRRVKGVWSKVLSVFQYTVSIALLICCAFIVMQSRFLAGKDVGLDRENVLIFGNTEGDADRRVTLKRLLSDIPGVEAVSFMARNPFNSWGGNWSGTNSDGETFSFEQFYVDTTFLRLFGVTVESTGAGRVEDAGYIYVNRKGYNILRPDSVSHEVRMGNNRLVIGGIMSDFNFRPLYESPSETMMTVEDNARWAGVMAVKISSGVDVLSTLDRVRGEYSGFTGNEKYTWEWADDSLRAFYEQERRTSRIMGLFSGLAILIMMMGIFAMSIYILRQKEREIALRKVNGSTIGEILTLLSRQSLVSVAVAFAIACPVALYAMRRWLEGFPYKIDLSWWVFAAAGLLVLALSMGCVAWQSWRAASANPVKALKSE